MADDKKSLHKGYVHYIPAVEERDDWDKDLTFVLIRSLDELRVHDVEHDYTAWDTETSGLDPDMDYLVGFSFSFDGETGYYVPVAHDDMALGTEAVEIFYSILKKTRKTQFLFNCRFDQRFLEAALKHKGWTLDGMPYYDVQNAIWLADTNVVMPSLKASERHFLGWKPKTFDETLGDAVTFQHVPAENAYHYACTDAVSTYQLAIVSNKFYRENLPASRFDNNMLYPLMRLENTPQRLDTEYLKSLVPQVEAIIERTREEVYRLAGTQFNLNAPQQFGKILVERFGVDTGARTATGAMKADLKTIDAWMVKHNSVIGQDIKDFIKAYKEYKKTVKFKSSYLDKYIKTASEQDIYPVRFSYKTNSVPCLTENNTVLVKDKGFISIKDVTQDDMIWTAWGYRRVLWNKAHDVDKVYRVTLQNGMTIEGTDRHPVLVRKSPLESINPHGMTKDDVEWAGLCDLKTGEPVIINHTCAASSCDNGKICILARIMGYFYGKGRNIDGSLFTLRFARGRTSSYYKELLVSLFGEKGVSRYDVDSKCVEYSVTRHVLSQLLEQFGLIPEIQADLHGNKKVDNVSVYVRVAHARSVLHDTFRHFLCGYLDSKGTSVAAYNVKDIPENWVDGIHKDRVVFIIPSKERDLIVPMLWAASVGCDVTEHSFQAWFGECKLTRIDIHEPYALSNLKDLWSDFDPLTERFSLIRFPKQMRLYLESEVANVEVVDGEIKVYDIEVEDVHEYVANGIVTHNTGRLSCGTSAKNKFFTNNNVQSTPKPHAVMLKGRKATEQEIAEKRDILGWYFSNEIPDEEAKGLVEGMDPDNLNIRRAFLPENDQCYVVSIDMCAEELRIVANLYHEDTWIKAFNSGADVHKACYSPDTEFYVKSQGWMKAEQITADMEIAYYDAKSDSFKFTRADKRATHKGKDVFVRSGVFNVTGNHRMYVSFDDRGYHIERADNLRNCGNAKQRFQMKTAVGNRVNFKTSLNEDTCESFILGFLSASDIKVVDKTLFVSYRPCFTFNYHAQSFIDKYCLVGCNALVVTDKGVAYLLEHEFDVTLGHVKDNASLFTSDSQRNGFVCGLLYGLSCRKDSTLGLGNGDDVHGRSYIRDKGLADWIQWHLTCSGYSCVVCHNIRSDRYALHIESRPNKDIGMTFHSVHGHSLTEGPMYSCFEVPGGLLVTRYDGRITVNGNTAVKLFGEENYTKDARKKAKCVGGDMELHMNNGESVCIRELVPTDVRNFAVEGEPIALHDKTIKISTPDGWSTVTHWIYNGIKPTLKLIIERHLVLEVTHDHLVGKFAPTVSEEPCKRYELVRADSLSVGDMILWDYAPMCITDLQTGYSDVYDITVDNRSHTFHVNGVVVHNCASFGILYGSGAQGFNQSFPDMTLDECREFMKKFKDALPAISQGQAENIAYARQYGDINTGFGRHRRVKFWLSSPDRAKQAFGERTTKNTAVQGTAADVLKIIFCRLWEKVFKPYPQVKFMSTIHDEVNFSIPIELAREVIPVCIECMTIEREDWPVPLKCSLSLSRTDLGSLIPFTYDAATDSYEPEWDTLEVKPKVTHNVETKVVATEDKSPSDDCVCGVSLDEIDF
jgi:DNA polymerase I-like protein with 3'-5' exonuclease and polymerase domains